MLVDQTNAQQTMSAKDSEHAVSEDIVRDLKVALRSYGQLRLVILSAKSILIVLNFKSEESGLLWIINAF